MENLEVPSALTAMVLPHSVLLSLIRSIANRQAGVAGRWFGKLTSYCTAFEYKLTFQQTFPQFGTACLPGPQPPFQRFRDLRLHHHAILLVPR